MTLGPNGNEAPATASGTIAVADKALDPVQAQSVQDRAHVSTTYDMSPIIFGWAMQHDATPAWWTPGRDTYLRGFWPTEPILSGALYNTQSKVRTTGWRLDGPPRQVSHYQELLNYADYGKGWSEFLAKLYLDFQSQDNGAWGEIIGPGDSRGPLQGAVTGLAHLDAGRVTRTGNLEYPIIYYSHLTGQRHMLHASRVFNITSMPSTVEDMYGVGYCAVSRVLIASRILKYINEYKEEKLGSRPMRGIVRAQGFQPQQVKDALVAAREEANNMGLLRYMPAAILASYIPGVETALEVVSLVSLPDNYDEQQTVDIYWDILANAFGVDRSEFAPIRSGQLGSGTQVDVQSQKARGKGVAEFFKSVEYALNWAVLPGSTTFEFDMPDDEQDIRANEIKQAKVTWIRALGASDNGQAPITPQEQRQLAADEELIPPEWLETDIFAEVQEEVTATEVPEEQVEEPAPEGVPEDADVIAQDTDVNAKARRLKPLHRDAILETLQAMKQALEVEANKQSPVPQILHVTELAPPAPPPVIVELTRVVKEASPPPLTVTKPVYDEEIEITERDEEGRAKKVVKRRIAKA